ncbi:ATP-binding cassette domain-containing protein [Desulfatiglans anilini]|uniref:ATP-binding cassette domain-containing protein n=1 Tax=Desulfatiglans anilini TaxID=90728 RepID=UPI000481CD10|nr:ATP-binding cassette domain-containing protein [Desulfatiglans anilini]
MKSTRPSPLVMLNRITLAFGGPPLLADVDLQVERGERICLIGRNGTGKSTLLRLVHGELRPDGGTITRASGLRTALLPQEVPLDMEGSVYDVVASGQGLYASLLQEYHHILLASRRHPKETDSARLEQVRRTLEAGDAWERHQQVQEVISRMDLDEAADSGTLSAGLKRRVYLARALANEPDILLLDEPTNHLDLDAILWMEQFLLRSVRTMLFVTHDRVFLDRLATRIVELDRGMLTSFPGRYEDYLARKQALLEVEARRNAAVDKQLKREEEWLRQGIKARRTRNEGRVRALMELRAEVARRRSLSGSVHLAEHELERSGKRVIEVRGVSFGYGGAPVVRDVSTTILRGDKVGIIGPNGCGKTTLLRILLGDLEPEAGRVKHGENLEVAYFDQLRAQLDPDKTVQQNVAGDGDKVIVGGKVRHVIGYLQDFLFTPEQARAPITRLSGGERNRLLLAKLFTRPANLLVLDEPTNDLDIETLELLEAMLVEFPGTVLIVSHDRAFLNHVVTSVLAFEGGGRVTEVVGGYDDWLRQRPKDAAASGPEKAKHAKPRPRKEAPRKLTFKEQRELELLPDRIEGLEAEKRDLFAAMAEPELYRSAGADVTRLQSRLHALEEEIDAAMARWEELEEVNLQSAK